MTISTTIGYATVHDIFVRGKDLSKEIIPNADFVEMVCLCMLGKSPEPNFKRMINVLLVTSTDHGFTPSSMCSRLTFLGAPESLQGAVAAGLLGAGDRYLGATQNVAEMLVTESQGLAADAPQADFEARARDLLTRYKAQKQRIYGVGHPIHVEGDPRVPALRAIAKETGYYLSCWRLLDAIEDINRTEFGRFLPINGAGAMGAIAADLGLDPKVARGLALVGRAAGLVSHILEEAVRPCGQEMWDVVLDAEKAAMQTK
ncbi:citryl-CoA lyase [Cupriavidus oxalaticus]|uniref:Citryl-CoA lyase n=1 Tax=Cupriavidus oxalaticus TaxID=96344 RepID=A0A5P3VW37_9BURK|nr:citryl-CoA lyase [Cupriavidus oxalaticus]QEZ48919.1 citryl-CoA lyase [Cupriavidus oxalaticus]